VLGEELPDGTAVSVIVGANELTFDLDEGEIAELRASIEAADRGEFVTLDEMLKRR
jgi:predicted transcriptional regulator